MFEKNIANEGLEPRTVDFDAYVTCQHDSTSTMGKAQPNRNNK